MKRLIKRTLAIAIIAIGLSVLSSGCSASDSVKKETENYFDAKASKYHEELPRAVFEGLLRVSVAIVFTGLLHGILTSKS
jgi:hypothetical protein